MYYRVAIQPKGSICWKWESTVLSSIDAVLRFLRRYQASPANRLRVFCSSSRDEMDRQLARENSGLESHSVTATQFLGARLIHTQEMSTNVPVHERKEEPETETIDTSQYPLQEVSAATHALNERIERILSVLDRRRIEAEWGAGSDHDLPYSFELPPSWPEALAWMKLLAKVRSGALSP